MNATEALKRLKRGNAAYCSGNHTIGDTGAEIRMRTAVQGQAPYAIIITCSDSRVIPEAIFDAGIGELFVIRVAGNVIDNHQLGSIEYAAGHLGTELIVVLGHTCCGAVDAAMNHDPDGYIKFITDEISLAIGDEQDETEACVKNVCHAVSEIEHSLEIQKQEAHGLRVLSALYHIDTGKVEFL